MSSVQKKGARTKNASTRFREFDSCSGYPSAQKRAPICVEEPGIVAVFLVVVAVEIVPTLVDRAHQPQLIFEIPLKQPDLPLPLLTAAAFLARPEPRVVGARRLILLDPLPPLAAADSEAELGRAQDREGEEQEGDEYRGAEEEEEKPAAAAASAEPIPRG